MQNPVIVNQKESIIPVFAYPKESEQGKETPFSNIIGHERQKKELLLVLEWFKHCEEWRQKGVYVPKGIILFGSPGNGKSLFMKEIIRCAGLPTFVYKGEESNIVEGLVETFEQAKKEVKSIVVIDELDLLIDRESRVTRALQEILDGVESMNNILVIAATNDIDEIPCALLRSGRLDKRISIENPTAEECLDMLRKALGDFGAIFPEEADEREIGNLLHGDSYAVLRPSPMTLSFETASAKLRLL